MKPDMVLPNYENLLLKCLEIILIHLKISTISKKTQEDYTGNIKNNLLTSS